LLQKWDMRFRILEDRRIQGANAQVCLWEVDVKPRDSAAERITVSGMDIIHVRDGRLSRDEAVMDRWAMMQRFG
ncbi:MAG: hypothetical protein ACT4RN_18300, partial [Pseudonocardia sp.]